MMFKDNGVRMEEFTNKAMEQNNFKLAITVATAGKFGEFGGSYEIHQTRTIQILWLIYSFAKLFSAKCLKG